MGWEAGSPDFNINCTESTVLYLTLDPVPHIAKEETKNNAVKVCCVVGHTNGPSSKGGWGVYSAQQFLVPLL